jgi:hypothetical protein
VLAPGLHENWPVCFSVRTRASGKLQTHSAWDWWQLCYHMLISEMGLIANETASRPWSRFAAVVRGYGFSGLISIAWVAYKFTIGSYNIQYL